MTTVIITIIIIITQTILSKGQRDNPHSVWEFDNPKGLCI